MTSDEELIDHILAEAWFDWIDVGQAVAVVSALEGGYTTFDLLTREFDSVLAGEKTFEPWAPCMFAHGASRSVVDETVGPVPG